MKRNFYKLLCLSLSFAMLLVMFAPFALHADEIMVGNGTSNTNMAPFGNAYVYSWMEMIYQSSEIGQACDITSLSFKCATTGALVL